MRLLRALVPAAVVAGSLTAGGAVVAATTPTVPAAGCIDPATAPTTLPAPTTAPAVPTTLAPGAVPFTSPEGDFTVTFPGEPQSQEVPGTGAATSTWRHATQTSEHIVSRTTLGVGDVVDLRVSCEGALATGGGTLVSSRAVTVDGRPAIEVVATVGQAGVVQRIIDGGTALYHLVVASADALTADDPAVTAFFDSFHLTGATAPSATIVLTVAAPTVAVPTVAAPTVAAPTVAVPTVAAPTVAAPTVAAPTVAGAPATTMAPLPGWSVFTSPTDGYSVAFPGEPELSNQPMPTGDGGTLPLSIARVDAGDRAWVVNSFAVPSGGSFDAEAGRDGSLGDFAATLVSSVPIELDGRTGVEFVGSFTQDGEPATVVSRIYSDGARVHQLIALAFGTIDATDTEVAAFFASFSFTGAVS